MPDTSLNTVTMGELVASPDFETRGWVVTCSLIPGWSWPVTTKEEALSVMRALKDDPKIKEMIHASDDHDYVR